MEAAVGSSRLLRRHVVPVPPDLVAGVLTGYESEQARKTRGLAVAAAEGEGAALLGGRIVTTPAMAGFANTVADGSTTGDRAVALGVLAVGEATGASGKSVLQGVLSGLTCLNALSQVLAGQGRFSACGPICIAVAVGSARVLRLPAEKVAEAASLAAVTSVGLNVANGCVQGSATLAVASACRSGVFAAQCAGRGMTGPVMPFEGKTGWYEIVVGREPAGSDFQAAAEIDSDGIAVRESFERAVGEVLGKDRSKALVACLWQLEDLESTSEISELCVIE